jgi:hypothetical protein
MPGEKRISDPDGWARLRFAIIGPLLADPPPSGELGARLQELAAKDWRHPVTGLPLRIRWRRFADVVGAMPDSNAASLFS